MIMNQCLLKYSLQLDHFRESPLGMVLWQNPAPTH
jgi:hypothetical protein